MARQFLCGNGRFSFDCAFYIISSLASCPAYHPGGRRLKLIARSFFLKQKRRKHNVFRRMLVFIFSSLFLYKAHHSERWIQAIL